MADENRWEQMRAIHCPDPQCAGMLLDNPFMHELKCSDCGKCFIEKVEYIEVKSDATAKPQDSPD